MALRRILVLALGAFLSVLPAFAQGGNALLVPADARALALAGTTLQPEAGRLDVRVFYGMWAPQTADNTLAGGSVWVRLSDRFSLDLEGRAFLDKPYDITSAGGQVTGSFRPTDLIFGLGGTFAATDFLDIRLKARMLSSSIGEDLKGSAFCGDLRVGYAGELFTVGLSARNIGSQFSYGAGGYALPMLAALDGTVSPAEGLTASAEVDYLFAGALMAGLGVEYTFADIVSLRGGFHYGDTARALPTFASLGLGLQYAGVRLDVTFLTASQTLGNTLLFGLGYCF